MVLVALAFAVPTPPEPVAAQSDEPQVGSVVDFTVDPSVAEIGGTIVVSGRCHGMTPSPNTGASIYLHRIVWSPMKEPARTSASSRLGANGEFSIELRIPTHWVPDLYSIGASCSSYDVVFPGPRQNLTITGATTGAIALDMSPGAVLPGENVRLAGTCTLPGPGAGIRVFLHETPTRTVDLPSVDYVISDTGAFDLEHLVPADAPPGIYTVSVLCTFGAQHIDPSDNLELRKYLVVLGPTPQPPPAIPAQPVIVTPAFTG